MRDTGMPPAHLPSDAGTARAGGPWTAAGVALLAAWGALLVVGVALWARAALLPDTAGGLHGLVLVVGTPFALVALGLLWWAWRSVGALRRGRREGWTLLLVLGGVAVAQTVMSAPAVVGAMGGTGGAGTGGGAVAPGPPREVLLGMLLAIALGLASLVVGLLGRRTATEGGPRLAEAGERS